MPCLLSLPRTLSAVLALGVNVAVAQTPAGLTRAEVAVNAPTPSRPANSAAPTLPRLVFAPGLIILRAPTVVPSSGSVASTSDSGDTHLSQQDLYYRGLMPAELFEHFSPTQVEDLGSLELNLHLPNTHSSISMGGGEVAMNGGMMSMALSAGLAEGNLEIASLSGKFGIRVQGRALYFRSPLMSTPFLSTANWVVTERPSFSAYYHF